MAKKKAAKKAASAKKTGAKAKAGKPAPDTTPVADPCAAGHKWETDGDGVEHCNVCLADKKVVEKAEKKKEPKAAKSKKPKAAPGKLSALDAAAQVLATSTEPLNTKQMIELMAAKGLWTSPGGATPHATLYSAILREIQVKGKEARFKKTERGHFAANG
jgi:conjugal transfer/entry exclusion protein